MTSERPGKTLVYLDADVLVPSIVRGLLVIGQQRSSFRVTWSPYAEAEATKHQRSGATPIGELRQRFGWSICDDAEPIGLVDTDPKDAPHLAAASAARARILISDNIRDYGVQDLQSLSMSAVTPDLFLATRLFRASYLEALAAIAAGRRREPNTPEDIHVAEVGPRLPRLAAEHAGAFARSPAAPERRPPTHVFRGVRCIRCGAPLAATDQPDTVSVWARAVGRHSAGKPRDSRSGDLARG